MKHSTRQVATTFFILLLAAPIVLFWPAIISGLEGYIPTASAQEPPDNDFSLFSISDETWAALGLSSEIIEASNASFNLETVKRTNTLSVASGSAITFTIAITNHGPDAAQYVFFRDDWPDEMQNVAFLFNRAVISDGLAKPTWVITEPIPKDQAAFVTVTGILTSAPNVTVKNQVTAASAGETSPANNTSEVSVYIAGHSPIRPLYLPAIFKSPPKVLLFSDGFSNNSNGWTTTDDSNCDRGFQDNEYRMKVDADKSCFTPAPSKAEYTYGEFQVSARVSDGDGEFAYGLYINGSGEDYYYLFRVKPDDECGWLLTRRKDGSSTTLASSGCVSAINRGATKNNLIIKHRNDGVITLYINGTQVYSINDGNSLTGVGTGLYAEADNDKDITVRFDDFRVYTIP
ncbi:MAG: DUF11 domain-containing protein [Anaerolineae bacterium]|nr:DUF11 domain-containing protein [Anaerolineae bacterium]